MKEQQIKSRISELIESYKNLFPQDYKAVCQMMEIKRKDLIHKDARVVGSLFLKRALFEIPETLDNFFSMKLNPEEMTWFKTKEGAIWFAKTFKEFAFKIW